MNEQKQHDNSVDMWDLYYASKRGVPLFEKIIHWGRKNYFGGAFARQVMHLGGKAESYLETGAGTGETLERIALATKARCVGVEKTPRAYELGKEQAKHCEMILGDALKLPLQNKTFDVSYSLGLFEHFEKPEQVQFLSEQARVTKNKVLVEVPTRTPYMMSIMWFNRNIRGLKGVWADDELFSKSHFAKKFPGLQFEYHFHWKSFGMTCWFVLDPKDIENWLRK